MTAPKLAQLERWGVAKSEGEARAYVDPRTLGKDQETKMYPSVTSVLRLVDKSDLSQWSADMAMKWAVANWQTLGSKSDEAAFNSGRYRWKDYRNERAAVGDGVHATIEAENEGTWNFPVLDDEQKRIIDRWHELKELHDIRPVLSEVTVYDTDLGYAGTLDGYWYIDGVPSLVDIKTSRKTWPDHYYQLGALWGGKEWAVESPENTWTFISPNKIDGVAIIHLREDFAEIIDVDMRLMPHYYDVFTGYLGVWKKLESLKQAQRKFAGF